MVEGEKRRRWGELEKTKKGRKTREEGESTGTVRAAEGWRLTQRQRDHYAGVPAREDGEVVSSWSLRKARKWC
jgi:hypothetical protein